MFFTYGIFVFSSYLHETVEAERCIHIFVSGHQVRLRGGRGGGRAEPRDTIPSHVNTGGLKNTPTVGPEASC